MDVNAYGQGSQFAYFSNSNFTSSAKISGDDQNAKTAVEDLKEMEKQNLQPVNQKSEDETKAIGFGQDDEDKKAENQTANKENDPLSFYERELEKQQQLKEKRIEEMKEEEKEKKAEKENKREELKEQQIEAAKKQDEARKQMIEQQLGGQFVVESAGTVEGIKNQLHQEEDKAFKLNNGVIPTAGGASFTV